MINEYVPHNENPIKTYRWGAEGLKYSSEFKGEMIVSDYRGDVLNAFSNGVNGYNAYGEKQKEKTKESSLGYCGEYTDSESGLIYLKNRYYDPEISRFITEDNYWNEKNMIYGDNADETKNPDIFSIVQSSNLYVYCMNNPLKYTDPSGYNIFYDMLNWCEDQIWKKIAIGVRTVTGWHLSADLIMLAASGEGNIYRAKSGSYASNLAKNDYGISQKVADVLLQNGTNVGKNLVDKHGIDYEIPLSNGDLGAALHKINIDVYAVKRRGVWDAHVTIRDTFDFTELKNPLKSKSWKNGCLWLANDIAYIDTKWGLLDKVQVIIEYNKSY